MNSMASRLRIPVETLWPMFDLALWHQDIDHDLTKPFKSWTPLIPGGRAYQQLILNSWLGGEQ
jgi:hypothetical protein